MRIRDLLKEAQEPEEINQPEEVDSDDDVEDFEDNEEDFDDDDEDDEDDDGGDLDSFKSMAGKLGNDLYSVTMYDYSNEFSSIGPNDSVRSMLEDFAGDPVIDQYLGVSESQISDDKIISAVILNDRVGKFFAYYSGDGIEGFSPVDSIQSLVQRGYLDANQTSALNRIKLEGKDYNKIVSDTYWSAGEEAEDSEVYDAMDGLTSALRLPDLPEPPRAVPDSELSDEQRARNQRINSGFKDEVEAAIQQYLAKQKKNAGAGRKKR